MRKKILISFYAFLIAAPLLGQQAPQAKSPEEAEALQALFAARDPDTRIEVAKKILKNFKNTEFKDAVLYHATVSYEEKNDIVNMQIYGERALEVNPDHVPTLVALAYGISLRTRRFDLDKSDKLAQSEDYAKHAMRLIPTMPKPNPQIPDDQWLLTKKDLFSQAHESLGAVAMLREDYAGAEESFRSALKVAAEPTGTTFFRLAQCLGQQGKYDEAIDAADKSIAAGGVRRGDGQDLAQLLKQAIAKAKPVPRPSDVVEPQVEGIEP